MSRPQPALICSHSEEDRVVEICEADAIYAVLYAGKPFKVRTHNPSNAYLGYKYGKSTFPEPGHAFRLARKLNEVHGTDAFTVAIMVPGRTISN